MDTINCSLTYSYFYLLGDRLAETIMTFWLQKSKSCDRFTKMSENSQCDYFTNLSKYGKLNCSLWTNWRPRTTTSFIMYGYLQVFSIVSFTQRKPHSLESKVFLGWAEYSGRLLGLGLHEGKSCGLDFSNWNQFFYPCTWLLHEFRNVPVFN